MTHGDKAKAKTGKSSQASGNQKSSPAAGKSAQGVEGSGQGGRQSGKADKIAVKKQNGGEKGGLPAPAAKKGGAASPSAKEAGSDRSKGRSAAEDAVAFSNPAIAAAFQRAVKKYPNAFRKLTD